MPPPTTTPTQLTDRAGVQQVLGRCGLDKRINVSRTTVVSAAEEETLTFCINYGSEMVFAYCGKQIAIATLQDSWLSYWWASIIAAYLLAIYRCGAAPASLQSEYDSTMVLLKQIYTGEFRPASMPSMSGAGIALDNVRLDGRYRTKQVRRESQISDGQSQQRSPVAEDVLSLYLWEPNFR